MNMNMENTDISPEDALNGLSAVDFDQLEAEVQAQEMAIVKAFEEAWKCPQNHYPFLHRLRGNVHPQLHYAPHQWRNATEEDIAQLMDLKRHEKITTTEYWSRNY